MSMGRDRDRMIGICLAIYDPWWPLSWS